MNASAALISRLGYDPYDALRPWSAITHGTGAVLAAAGTLALLALSCASGSLYGFWIFTVYGLSLIGLYTASTLYHCINTTVRGRVALRKYDHSSIFLLIAGSYTPVCMLVLGGAAGWRLFALVWATAAVGMTLSLTWAARPRWVTSTLSIFMGWLALSAIGAIHRAMTGAEFFLLVLGGALYTLGGVLYAVKWPLRDSPRFGCHEVFHVLILAGSVCHFIMMLLLARAL